MYDVSRRSVRPAAQAARRSLLKTFSLTLVLLVAGALVYAVFQHQRGALGMTHASVKVAQVPAAASDQKANTAAPKTQVTTGTTAQTNQCAGNTLSKLALVSISQRHMWACQASTLVYNSAVVTGMQKLAADLTPTGTYHIYAKETNLYLKGHDSTGSWNDYVNYWMPFLDNQYGAYGFHDATWRPANAFGNISPYSSNASHGCVELPLATAKWLYGWAEVGTTVTIES